MSPFRHVPGEPYFAGHDAGGDVISVRFTQNQQVTALRAHGVEVPQVYDGLDVWLPLCHEPASLVSLMEVRGWLMRAGAGFYLTEPGHAIRLTTGSLMMNSPKPSHRIWLTHCASQVM